MEAINWMAQGVAALTIGLALVAGAVFGCQRIRRADPPLVECRRESGLPGAAEGKLYFRDRLPGGGVSEWRYVGYCGRDGKLVH